MSEQEIKELHDNYIFRNYILIFIILALILLILAQVERRSEVYAETAPQQECNAAVTINAPAYRGMSLPDEADGSFKSYMDYRKITDRTSKQWLLQQLCTTDAQGFRRFNGDYVVAVGTGYADAVGRELIITLSSGVIFTAIVGDIKQDRHTDATNRYAAHGNIIEFIVDTLAMDHEARILGDVSGLDMFGAVIGLERK